MADKVTLTLSVTPTLAMQILMLLKGGEVILPTLESTTDENGPSVSKAVQDSVDQVEDEEPEDEEPEAEEPEDEEPEAEEPEDEEPEDEEPEDEEPEDEEPEDEEPEDEEPEYTLADIREALADFMGGYKTQAAGKKALGSILAGLPTPAKCLSDVAENEYGLLMNAINGDDDPLS